MDTHHLLRCHHTSNSSNYIRSSHFCISCQRTKPHCWTQQSPHGRYYHSSLCQCTVFISLFYYIYSCPSVYCHISSRCCKWLWLRTRFILDVLIVYIYINLDLSKKYNSTYCAGRFWIRNDCLLHHPIPSISDIIYKQWCH